MSAATWAARHRRSILFLLALLALGGAASSLGLPVALFPRASFPRIVVSLDAGDRPGEQMEVAVTRPVEQAVRGVPGVREIRSTTSRGSVDLSVNFAWGTDMAMALAQVESAVNGALPSLPAGTRFAARRMDPTVFPVAAYSLTSETRSLVALRDLARFTLVPALSAVDGVARVEVVGGEEAEYQVEVDPARLAAYGLSIGDVVTALSASNVLQAVGRIEDRDRLFLVLADTRFSGPDPIRHTVLKSGADGLVELEDIATVRTGTVPHWQRVTADGRDAVSVEVYQQPAGNTVQIVREVKRRLADLEAKGAVPADVAVRTWYDQSELITGAAASVRDAILMGVVLAALVLLLFLRSPTITLVAVLVVPAVLAATVLLLYVLDMSFNIMTLGGMAAAVGLIVDDAVVMIEVIVRRLRESPGESHHDLVRAAAREFVQPLTGSSASTVVIFLPLAFLSGVTGAFFKALSLTMASALAISYLVTWLAVPLLADHLIRARDVARDDRGAVTRAAERLYARLMGRLLDRRWLAALAVLPLVLGGYAAWRAVGSGFMPPMDEGGFVLDYRAAPGTSLTETDRLLRQVEGLIRATPEVASYSRRTGTQLGGGITEASEGDFFIRLKPPPRRPVEAIMDDLRGRVQAQVPGLEIDFAQLMEDLIGDLTAVPQPIEIKLFGDDLTQLMDTAPRVAAAAAGVRGVVDVRDGIVLAGDALDVEVDRAKAALEGIDPEAVTQQVAAWFEGVVTTQVQQGVRLVGIRVWVPQALRARPEDVEDMRLAAPDGHRFALRRVATLRTVTGQPQIVRDNLKRMVAVTGRISGRDMGSTVAEVQQVLARPGLIPRGVTWELGGLYRQQRIAFRGLVAVLAAAVALEFLLLLFLYERFQVALAILAMPLLALGAVFIGLWITGTELNITAMMGMTMVVGIVTEIAIFYFSEYRALAEAGAGSREALVRAGVNRMRPIAMTTLAAMLALLPLALGLGQGSAMQQPLAIAILSGLAIQMPLVLLVMPVLYAALERNGGPP